MPGLHIELSDLRADEEGQGLAEYGLVIVLVAIAAFVALAFRALRPSSH